MMRFAVSILTFLGLVLAAGAAQAKSCSAFVVIKSYDAENKMATVKYEKGSEKRYFPKTEGANTETTKIPKKCKKRLTAKNPDVKVKPTGGRMSVTQVRSNFEGRMLNDLEDETYVPGQLEKLKADKTRVMAILKPGPKDDVAPTMTTIYLPITDEEKAEIARINAEAEDVE